MVRLLLNIILICIFFQLFPANRGYCVTLEFFINGMVYNEVTSLPIKDAVIFLNSTKMKSASDEKGKFELISHYKGNFELVVYCPGYEVYYEKVLLLESDNIHRKIALTPQKSNLRYRLYSKTGDRKWEPAFNIFRETVLGLSDFADECRITNPDALMFRYMRSTNEISAAASEPILIKNQALGYRINYILDSFYWKGRVYNNSGYYWFEQLNGNPAQIDKWKYNRNLAYCGSRRHFLFSLLSGNLEKEGFNINITNRLFTSTMYIADSINTQPYEIISYGDNPFEKKLIFDGYLNISFTSEETDFEFNFHKDKQRDYPRFGTRFFWNNSDSLSLQSSWIKSEKNGIIVDLPGSTPYSNTQDFGYFKWEKLAGEIPIEISLEKNNINGIKTKYPPAGDQVYYEEGLKLKNEGDWEEALNTWLSGKKHLESFGRTNPKLGLAFIELAAEKHAFRYYENACKMYTWGFSQDNTAEYFNTYLEEAFRLITLLDYGDKAKFYYTVMHEDNSLYSFIREFWINSDPDLITVENERLLEHWERIAYARENYNSDSVRPFGTDERGNIHIKYGFPDKFVKGNFGEYYVLQTFHGIVTHFRDVRTKVYPAFKPEFEFWFYNELHKKGDGRFIFARNQLGDTFKRKNYIKEIIPYSPVFTNQDFYNSIVKADLYLANNYNEPGSWNPNNDYWAKKDEKENILHQNTSIYDDLISPLDIEYYTFRYLDEDNNSSVAVFGNTVISDSLIPKNNIKVNSLVKYNSEWNEIERHTDEMPGGVSIFRTSYPDTTISLILASRVSPFFADDISAFAQDSTTGMFTAGKSTITPFAPLNTDQGVLEISDLIIGSKEGVPGDFPILPQELISRLIPLEVYYEIYHLFPNVQSVSNYKVDFLIRGIDERSFMDKVRLKQANDAFISQSFIYNSRERRVQNSQTFDISGLMPGKYEIVLTVTDLVSGQTKSRKTELRIQ